MHGQLLHSLHDEAQQSQAMEDNLVKLLEETCVRVEKTVLIN